MERIPESELIDIIKRASDKKYLGYDLLLLCRKNDVKLDVPSSMPNKYKYQYPMSVNHCIAIELDTEVVWEGK